MRVENPFGVTFGDVGRELREKVGKQRFIFTLSFVVDAKAIEKKPLPRPAPGWARTTGTRASKGTTFGLEAEAVSAAIHERHAALTGKRGRRDMTGRRVMLSGV